MSPIPESLREKFKSFGQEDVFKFADQGMLSDEDAAKFIKELEELDLAEIQSIYESSMIYDKAPKELGDISPLDDSDSVLDSSEETIAGWESTGYEAIGRGEVAALVLSGGQGTRLGFPGPKGMYDIGLPSKKTLFQLFAERIVRLQQLASEKAGGVSVKIPFYIMTSQMNDSMTRSFFQENNFFGLEESQFFFFAQGTLPCLTEEGKLILETPSKIARASDGNGGIYPAMIKSGSIKHMEDHGVKYIHVFSVDNAICKVADPVFMGYCISKKADCGNKVVWKTAPNESVGVVAKRGGKFCVIEYSEITAEQASETDASGKKLAYGAGNICNHFYSIEFIRDVISNEKLIYHIARKKIPYAGEDGMTVKPANNTGIKMEAFIFDVFSLSKRMAVLEVAREDEFTPVKNAPGSATDSPDTARFMISSQSKRWAGKSGASFVNANESEGKVTFLSKEHEWISGFYSFNDATHEMKIFDGEDKSTTFENVVVINMDNWAESFAGAPSEFGFTCKLTNGRKLPVCFSTEEEKNSLQAILEDSLKPENVASKLYEVSTLVSYGGEGLEKLKDESITLPKYISSL